MFRRGLKEEVKKKLAFDGTYLKDFDALIKRSIKLDNAIYERYQKRRFDRKKYKNRDGYVKRSEFRFQPPSN